MITAVLALIMAMILLIFLKPAFEGLWINQYLKFDLQENVSVYFIFVGLALVVGFVAGTYPALFLSKFQPVKALKNIESSGIHKLGLRKLLNVSQFVISLFFITTSILIYKQFNHFLEFDYGFNSSNIVNIPLQGNNYKKVLNEFNMISGVSTISACDYLPSTGTNNGMGLKSLDNPNIDEEYKKVVILLADENFITNLDIKLLAGRNLLVTDSSDSFILMNASAVKAFGYQSPNEIIDKSFESSLGKETLEVVGVIDDFRVKTPLGEDQISPMVMRNQPQQFAYLSVKIISKDMRSTLIKLQDKWASIDPAHAFKYEFYDQQLVHVSGNF